MAITFHCSRCDASRTASGVLAGRKARCPECGEIVEIPVAAQAAGAGRADSATRKPSADARRTVAVASSSDDDSQGTVMLEAIPDLPPVEVNEVIDIEEPPLLPPEPPADDETELAEQQPPPRLKSKRALQETEMDMTSMIDVTFLLLIFFTVTASFITQMSKEIPKPNPDDPSSTPVVVEDDEGEKVTVQVDEFNTFHVVTSEWEEEAPSEQDLIRFLRRARDGNSSTGQIPTVLMVEAHGDAFHEKVVAALDAGSVTGFEQVKVGMLEDE